MRPVAGSANLDQVDHEDQRLTGSDDAAGAAVAVRELWGDVDCWRPPTFIPGTLWSSRR